MTTDFFKKLYEISAIGTFNISLKVGTNNMMLMALVFTPESGTAQTKKSIPPIVFKGTVDEFTVQFFEKLISPVVKTNEFFVNHESYGKAVDKAKLELAKSVKQANQSAKPQNIEGEKQDGEDDLGEGIEIQPLVSKEEKRQSFIDAMAEVENLVIRFKYEDALAILPLVSEFPDKEKQILAKEKDLKFQSRQYTLLT